MNDLQLQKILELHKKWFLGEPEGVRASLCGADLYGANLSNADLREANLYGANLRDAGLREANLSGANLYGANLSLADLREANLSGADLRESNLNKADLSRADLSRANLDDADLSGADLDFSVLPLWCGSLTAHFDDKQLIQIAYHLVKAGLYSKNASVNIKDELRKLISFANKFHRVNECGKIEGENEQ